MDKVQVTTRKYIGKNKSPNIFSAVFMHTSRKDEVRQARGDMYTSVSLYTVNGAIDVSPFISEILDKLEDQYFGSVTGTVMGAMELALKAAFECFVGIQEKKEVDDLTFDLSALIIWGDIAYLGRIGKAGLYVIRQGNVINISESLIEIDEYEPISVASGILQSSDIFVLSTPLATELIVNWKNLATMEEEALEDYMRNMDPSEGLSMLFAQIGFVKDQEEQEDLEQVSSQGERKEEQPKDRHWKENVLSLLVKCGSKIRDIAQKGITFLKTIDYAKVLESIKNIHIQELKKYKRIAIASLVVLFVIFILILLLTKRAHGDTNKMSMFNAYINQVSASVATINPTDNAQDIQNDDALLAKDKKLLRGASALQVDSKKVAELSSKVQQKYNSIHDIIPINNYSVLTDLGITYANAQPSQIVQQNGKIFVLDSALHQIVTVNDSGSQVAHAWIDASNGSANPISISGSSNGSLFLFDKTNGTMETSMQNNSPNVNAIAGLGEIANVSDIDVFGTTNTLYFLDPVDGDIFKASSNSDGSYNIAQSYITDNNIQHALSMQVDGNIFILPNKSKTLLRYYGGVSTPFQIGNTQVLGKGISNIDAFFDADYTNNIYLLDRTNQRIIVLSKPQNGANSIVYNVSKQYVYQGNKDLFRQMSGLYVSRDESALFLICGQKIVKVNL